MSENRTTGRKTTTRKRRRTARKKAVSRTQRFLAQIKIFGNLVRQNIIIVGLTVVCLIVLLVWGALGMSSNPETGYEVGMKAPAIELQTIAGQTITSNDIYGTISIIAFWHPSQWNFTTDWEKLHLVEQLQKIEQRWAGSNISVLAIVPESNLEAARRLVNEQGVTFPLAIDQSENTFNSFGIAYEPTQVFIDPKGIIRNIVPGLFKDQVEIDTIISAIQHKNEIETSRPVISDVQVTQVTDKRAEVSFITDKPANGWLIGMKYTEDSIESSNIITTPIQSYTLQIHSLALTNLEAETTYHFRVFAVSDADGKYPSQSREYGFTTLVDTTPPAISNVQIADITESSFTITWSTDEPATTYVEYPVHQWPNKIAASSNEFVLDHGITLEGLKPDTAYVITLKSKDPAGYESDFVSPEVRTLPLVGNKTGMRAPDFTLPALDGTTITMSDYLGKIILVNFWLTHCGACQAEIPYIQALYDKWPKNSLALMAITIREEPEAVRDFMNKNGLTFPVLLDVDGLVDARYQPEGFPTTYFIDTMGIIRRIELGRFSSLEEIEEILESLQ